tara:strand:+ start:12241 stop:12765 length:525 start_codon:yes stop_codon:yes gene_type:complete
MNQSMPESGVCTEALDGGCSCGDVRFRMLGPPMIVHCCHCSWCQRECGSGFVLNALIESDRVQLLAGAVEQVDTPSASGAGQKIVRCSRCSTALWSHYAFAGIGEQVKFVRVGTLDKPALLPPDVHIFTSTKLAWLTLAEGSQVFPEYYRAKDIWSADSLQRRQALTAARTSHS